MRFPAFFLKIFSGLILREVEVVLDVRGAFSTLLQLSYNILTMRYLRPSLEVFPRVYHGIVQGT